MSGHDYAAAIEDMAAHEANYLAIAEELGYVERADGQDGYTIAPLETILEAIRELKRDAGCWRDLPVCAECGCLSMHHASIQSAPMHCLQCDCVHFVAVNP